MSGSGVLYWIIYFIATVIIAWIALSLIIIWARPAFYNGDGSVNWWTTLWVAAVVILLAWLIIIILAWLIGIFRRRSCGECEDSGSFFSTPYF